MDRAIVVGAGIGGLAVGRVLREVGFEVRILERSPSLEPEGAGVSIWPNAVRVLRHLGLMELLPEPAKFGPDAGLRRWDGRLVGPSDSAQIERRYGAPVLLLGRMTLHDALLSGGIARLVETGTEVAGVKEADGRALAELTDGEIIDAELLIGADGIGSAVRSALLADGPPQHSGLLAYRAIIDRPPLPIDVGEYWGNGSVFGLVPIDGNRLYWFATRRTSGGEPPEADPRPGLLERHRGWAFPIAEVIEATPPERIIRHDLLDRKTTRRWTGKQIALLGDAVHPMLPFLGQGACQALEDAEALGRSLKESTDIPAALRAYEAQRRNRAARIVKLSRRMGWLAHLRSRPLRSMRDRAISITPHPIRIRQLDPVIGRQTG